MMPGVSDANQQPKCYLITGRGILNTRLFNADIRRALMVLEPTRSAYDLKSAYARHFIIEEEQGVRHPAFESRQHRVDLCMSLIW